MAMGDAFNALGQSVGEPVPDWVAPPAPARQMLNGSFCRLEPIDPAVHAAVLHAANGEDVSGAMWTYLPYGPFATPADYREWMERTCVGEDPLFLAIVDLATGQAAGLAAYLRIDAANGVLEIGHLAYAPRLQRTAAATEAMYLMLRNAFDLGYRRCEWKCDVLNEASRAAAVRLGFTYEGTFRQAVVRKGRNRDTAWYSIIDREWPARRTGFERWLAPANFDADGRQRRRLADLVGCYL
jgi:RimJ/RimL family protein N-acetyltransferase